MGSPICGAAKPTPGASRMVSCIHPISCCVFGVSISAGVSGRATILRTGSPTWTIFSLILLIMASDLHDLATVPNGLAGRLDDQLVVIAVARSRHYARDIQLLQDLLLVSQRVRLRLHADTALNN